MPNEPAKSSPPPPLSPEKQKEETEYLARRLEQCASTLREVPPADQQKLPPGTLLLLVRYLEERILQVLAPGSLSEFRWGGATHRRGSAQEPREGYGQVAAFYDEVLGGRFGMEEQLVFEVLGELRGKAILDVGCGTGRFSIPFAERGARVTGVDLSPEMLAQARRRASETNLPLELMDGDAMAVDLGDRRFDVVFSSLAVTHLPELAPFVARMRPHLRSGGRILLSDMHPNAQRMGIPVGMPIEGTYRFIRHHIHPISEYFEAATCAGLTFRRLVEYPKEWVQPLWVLVEIGEPVAVR